MALWAAIALGVKVSINMILIIGIILLVLSSRVLQHSQRRNTSKVSILTFLNGSDHAMIACYYIKKVKSSISMIPIPNIYSLVV